MHSMVARISLVAKVPASLAWLPVPADAVCSRELSWLHWFARLQDAMAACVRVHSMVACIDKVQATIADTACCRTRRAPQGAVSACTGTGLLAYWHSDVPRSVRGLYERGGRTGERRGAGGGTGPEPSGSPRAPALSLHQGIAPSGLTEGPFAKGCLRIGRAIPSRPVRSGGQVKPLGAWHQFRVLGSHDCG